MSVYDAYDPYNSNPYDSSPRYKSNNPTRPDNGYRSSASMHDPAGYRAPSLQDPGYRAPSLQDAAYRTPSLQDPTYRSSNLQQQPQDPGYRTNYPIGNGYNGYPDYKPVPPPKSNAYKPVPPPKPKSSNGSINPPESNYMNSNSNPGGYASSVHYHSSNINKPMFMNGNRYSDEVDSGQGSSLDRDYGLYNNYPKQSNNNSRNQQDQYYYNLPQQQNGGTPPRREGLDLTNNREYRGSAFELYKKPLSEAKPTQQPPQNQYYSNQTMAR